MSEHTVEIVVINFFAAIPPTVAVVVYGILAMRRGQHIMNDLADARHQVQGVRRDIDKMTSTLTELSKKPGPITSEQQALSREQKAAEEEALRALQEKARRGGGPPTPPEGV